MQYSFVKPTSAMSGIKNLSLNTIALRAEGELKTALENI
jgi:hypothetical protein